MIRTSETLRKQIEAAKASREPELPTLSDKDRILSILDSRLQKIVVKASITSAMIPSFAVIDFREEPGFPHGNISCQLAGEVKRHLNEAGYDDVSVFRESDSYYQEKRCVRIQIGVES